MKKVLIIVLLLRAGSLVALTPTEQIQQNVRSVLKELKTDPTKANTLCPQVCNNFAAQEAPEVACGVCYDTCKPKRDVRSQRMMRTCAGKGYPEKCCGQIGKACVAKDVTVDQLKVSESTLRSKIEDKEKQIARLQEQNQVSLRQRAKMVNLMKQVQGQLEVYKKGAQKYQQVKKYIPSCDYAILSYLKPPEKLGLWNVFQVSDFLEKLGNKYLTKNKRFEKSTQDLLEKAIKSLNAIVDYRVRYSIDPVCQKVLNMVFGYEVPDEGILKNMLGKPVDLVAISNALSIILFSSRLKFKREDTTQRIKGLLKFAQESLKKIEQDLTRLLTMEAKGGETLKILTSWREIPKKIQETVE